MTSHREDYPRNIVIASRLIGMALVYIMSPDDLKGFNVVVTANEADVVAGEGTMTIKFRLEPR